MSILQPPTCGMKQHLPVQDNSDGSCTTAVIHTNSEASLSNAASSCRRPSKRNEPKSQETNIWSERQLTTRVAQFEQKTRSLKRKHSYEATDVKALRNVRSPRGKDMMAMLHRRAQDLDAREARIQQAEFQNQEDEVRIQEEEARVSNARDRFRKEQKRAKRQEKSRLAWLGNLEEMQKRLWSKEQANLVEKECFICFEREIDCIMIPCGHMVACWECASKLKRTKRTCCICNQKAKLQRIYRS